MTDEELTDLRAEIQHAARVLNGGFTISKPQLDALTAEYANRYVSETLQLLDDVQRWREIGRIVADGRLAYSEQPDGWLCTLCDAFTPSEWGQRGSYNPESETDRAKRVIQHDDDCPVTQARTLLGES